MAFLLCYQLRWWRTTFIMDCLHITSICLLVMTLFLFLWIFWQVLEVMRVMSASLVIFFAVAVTRVKCIYCCKILLQLPSQVKLQGYIWLNRLNQGTSCIFLLHEWHTQPLDHCGLVYLANSNTCFGHVLYIIYIWWSIYVLGPWWCPFSCHTWKFPYLTYVHHFFNTDSMVTMII